MLIINSILHFVIDGICAYMMSGVYGANDPSAYLFYNFCAFALQMPFGALADLICLKLFGTGNFLSSFMGISVYIRLFWIIAAIFLVAAGLYILFREKRHDDLFSEESHNNPQKQMMRQSR